MPAVARGSVFKWRARLAEAADGRDVSASGEDLVLLGLVASAVGNEGLELSGDDAA